MSRPAAPIVCDGPGCTNRKQQYNRWWTVQVGKAKVLGLMVVPGSTSKDDWIEPWEYYDLCGETCVLKFISEQMGKVTS